VQITAGPVSDPWKLELIAVRGGGRSSGERSAISRDVERGLLRRIGPGCYVEGSAFEALSPEAQHIVRMRAADAVSPEPLTFSHWSAAALWGLPVLRSRLRTVHDTIPEGADQHRQGITAHRHHLDEASVTMVGGLRVTCVVRTVIDVAGGSSFEEGVMVADGVLLMGTRREQLEDAADAAGDRRSSGRIGQVVGFGDPGGESAAESRFRVSSMRAGFEPPELQHRMRLADGRHVRVDGWYRRVDVGVEVDGDQKYLDAEMAPDGAGAAVIREKRREDEVRLGLRALVRPGWVQSGSPTLLKSMLAKVGVFPTSPRTPIDAYIERSRESRPRLVQRGRSPRSALRP
jgi:hypothetical protein